jgi:hypothetical protein
MLHKERNGSRIADHLRAAAYFGGRRIASLQIHDGRSRYDRIPYQYRRYGLCNFDVIV